MQLYKTSSANSLNICNCSTILSPTSTCSIHKQIPEPAATQQLPGSTLISWHGEALVKTVSNMRFIENIVWGNNSLENTMLHCELAYKHHRRAVRFSNGLSLSERLEVWSAVKGLWIHRKISGMIRLVESLANHRVCYNSRINNKNYWKLKEMLVQIVNVNDALIKYLGRLFLLIFFVLQRLISVFLSSTFCYAFGLVFSMYNNKD